MSVGLSSNLVLRLIAWWITMQLEALIYHMTCESTMGTCWFVFLETIFGIIAREMRKYYVSLLVVDQRPSGIDQEPRQSGCHPRSLHARFH